MPNEESPTSRTDRRVLIAIAAQLVGLVFGVPAFFEMASENILLPGFEPAWWFYPAAVISLVATLYAAGTLSGRFHTPEKQRRKSSTRS